MLDLLTIGETMGLITTPTTGPLVAGEPVMLSFGGAESNVAAGAATLGTRTAWLSAVGDDAVGRMIVAELSARGVNTSPVRVDPYHPTGLMLKSPAPTGSTVTYYRRGSAASHLSMTDITHAPPARITHLSGILPALSVSCRGLVEEVFRTTRAPALVSFDVNYRPALWPSVVEAAGVLQNLAGKADIVLVGRDEAETLWGTATAEDVRLLLPHVPHLIVKDGDVEAVEFHRSTITRVPAQAVDVVEPVGAGDAFAAGWFASYLRGEPAQTRLLTGHSCAARVLRSTDDLLTITPRERA